MFELPPQLEYLRGFLDSHAPFEFDCVRSMSRECLTIFMRIGDRWLPVGDVSNFAVMQHPSRGGSARVARLLIVEIVDQEVADVCKYN